MHNLVFYMVKARGKHTHKLCIDQAAYTHVVNMFRLLGTTSLVVNNLSRFSEQVFGPLFFDSQVLVEAYNKNTQ